MKKLRLMTLTLIAVFVFSAMTVATAGAETTLLAEWLVDGAPIPVGTSFPFTLVMELLWEDDKTFVGAVAALCVDVWDGTLGPEGEGLIEKVLNKSGIEVGLLTGGELECANEHNCEGAKIWPDKLPWPILLFLMENGEFLLLIEGHGLEWVCTVLGSKVEDLCEALDSEWLVVNDVGGFVLMPEGSVATPNANCTQGGAGSGVHATEGDSTLKIIGHTLQVSSE